ncbi:hypothetical protein GCK72_001635 [Caenorhabditis remanei]|uniref:Uncharacterized protein n=1 Tax=Caenorhabditis remanei TaxID=31234 RepID=A0A6A5HPH5_CAERE|nr:hypothetical protein GCK72_001635 [Caenorhabditis remanei]KAF1769818.1 hypothetical protein GCK72_001635 [Caenorhabditis remanei]
MSVFITFTEPELLKSSIGMLAARGVSLGLGKINLSDLNQLPQDRILAAQYKKSQDAKNKKPKIIIKKKADAKVSWFLLKFFDSMALKLYKVTRRDENNWVELKREKCCKMNKK